MLSPRYALQVAVVARLNAAFVAASESVRAVATRGAGGAPLPLVVVGVGTMTRSEDASTRDGDEAVLTETVRVYAKTSGHARRLAGICEEALTDRAALSALMTPEGFDVLRARLDLSTSLPDADGTPSEVVRVRIETAALA